MANSFKVPEDQRVARARAPASNQVGPDEVDRASFDSFPASDPPPWNGIRLGPPCDTCDSIGDADDGR
jgi:hypothetical protein